MTCQCTCGKHMLVERIPLSYSNPAVAAAAGGVNPLMIHEYNTGAWQPRIINITQDTAAAAPTMPNFSVRIEL